MEFRGELKEDAVWSGSVTLTGDVLVPAGRTLRVSAGAQILAADKPKWSCSVFRGAPEGYPIEATARAACDIVVLGRLEIEGSATQPARLGSPGWGGITLLESGRARLSHCALSGAREHLIQCFDDSGVSLSDCDLSSAKVGVLTWGLSRVEGRSLSIRDAGTGLLAREGSFVRCADSRFERLAQGAWGQHWAILEFSGCRWSACAEFGAGAYDHATLEVEGGAMTGCATGLMAGSSSRMSARGVDFSDNNTLDAWAIEQSRLKLSRLAGARQPRLRHEHDAVIEDSYAACAN